ncbi:MAG: V-type ATP synthase subunit D [Clostridiales bacterium]|nr:V-type ATP synthase subunit D [Clostridiales bacterium]
MDQVFPTKGNLMATKKSLELARLGYDLMDRKRSILVQEMMTLIDRAEQIQNEIDGTYQTAYQALQRANITLGFAQEYLQSIPEEDGLRLDFRSVMGLDLPFVNLHSTSNAINYPMASTNSMLDDAFVEFQKVKELTARLAEVESSVYLLAHAVRKVQKRANALKNIVIPQYEHTVKFIAETLEEKEREDFTRLKAIKKQKQ